MTSQPHDPSDSPADDRPTAGAEIQDRLRIAAKIHEIFRDDLQPSDGQIGFFQLDKMLLAQTDALDPVNAMFWAWNTGYIFLKLEGRSSFSKLPGNIFEYHIGGYKSPSNCIRTISLNFERPLQIENNKLNFMIY